MSENIVDNNKRIAKNTLYMYFRMSITLVVSIFTARVVLNALGVHDYGLYNVVGGFVALLGYLNALLSQGSSRFLTVALGKGDEKKLRDIFSACLTIHLGIALFTLLIGETIGLWFVNNKLVIDANRMFAANIVYQLSLFSAILSIMQAPYSASVVSHEKMSVYAYMSIFDVIMKLLIIYLLLCFDGDRLILYSSFYFTVGVLNVIFYRIYCIRNFSECSLKLGYDKLLYKDIFNYVGWNSVGTFAFMANGQGVNVLLNMFFGTVVNTARGIAMSLCGYVNQFVSNFQVAVNPQTIKYCASGNTEQMNRLIINNAKYSSYLMLFVGLPVFLETEYVLKLWLGQVPQYTVEFVRLTIIQLMIQAIDFPIGAGIHAYGKMKLPNLTSSIVYLFALPLSYVFMKLGSTPIVTYIVTVCVYPVALIFDLWILNKYSGFNRKHYFMEVVVRGLGIILFSAAIPFFLHIGLPYGFCRFVIVIITVLLATGFIVYYWGISSSVRYKLVATIKNKLKI